MGGNTPENFARIAEIERILVRAQKPLSDNEYVLTGKKYGAIPQDMDAITREMNAIRDEMEKFAGADSPANRKRLEELSKARTALLRKEK